MKNFKNIAVILAVIIAVLMSIDDSFSLLVHDHAIELPLQADCSDISHHHHSSITDHYFDKSSNPYADTEHLTCTNTILKDQSITDHYLASIWQPPQISC